MFNKQLIGDLSGTSPPDLPGRHPGKTVIFSKRTCIKIQCSYIVSMSGLSFEWDTRKNKSNKSKHGVSFEEAQTVFLDENARYMSDPDSSQTEERFVILGLSRSLKLLTVCHCYRSVPDSIRIISARKATRTEAKWYSPN